MSEMQQGDAAWRWSNDLATVQRVKDIHEEYTRRLRLIAEEAAYEALQLRMATSRELQEVTGEPQPIIASSIERRQLPS